MLKSFLLGAAAVALFILYTGLWFHAGMFYTQVKCFQVWEESGIIAVEEVVGLPYVTCDAP